MAASPPVIRVIDQQGEHGVSAAPVPTAPEATQATPDAIARLLDEGTPDDVRAWLLQQGSIDQNLFAPINNPLRELAVMAPFASAHVSLPPLFTPIVADAPITSAVTRLPVSRILTSAPTTRGQRITPSPQAGQYARTTRLNPTAFASEIDQTAGRLRLDPDLVRAVIHVESTFNPRARSHKGASGLMQLMPATARQWGVSSPHDARQNISGGSQYLAHLLSRYNGNTALALAAYNAGEGAVNRYGGIPPYRETIDYVEKVLTLWKRYRGPERALEIRRVQANHSRAVP